MFSTVSFGFNHCDDKNTCDEVFFFGKKVDRKVLKWFGHVERMRSESLAIRVNMS